MRLTKERLGEVGDPVLKPDLEWGQSHMDGQTGGVVAVGLEFEGCVVVATTWGAWAEARGSGHHPCMRLIRQ